MSRDASSSCIEDLQVQLNHNHVAPPKWAVTSVFPVLSAFDLSPCSSGLVAAATKACSKSFIMSSKCSIPTEMRMRSCRYVSCTDNLSRGS